MIGCLLNDLDGFKSRFFHSSDTSHWRKLHYLRSKCTAPALWWKRQPGISSTASSLMPSLALHYGKWCELWQRSLIALQSTLYFLEGALILTTKGLPATPTSRRSQFENKETYGRRAKSFRIYIIQAHIAADGNAVVVSWNERRR